MVEKKLKTRIINKHETQEDWEAVNFNFIPLLAELIVYDPDSTYTQARLKIGDGKTNVKDLPYVGQFLEAKEYVDKAFAKLQPKVLYGTEAPSSNIGVDGDIYIQIIE